MRPRLSQLTARFKKQPLLTLAGAATLVPAIAIASGAFESKEGSPAPTDVYVTAEPVRDDASSASGVTGIVQSVTPLQASAVIGGRVISLHANIGDQVAAGDVLAIVDGKAASLRVKQAESELRRVEAVASERSLAAKRADALVVSGALSEAERETLRAEAKSASDAVQTARAAMALAQNDATLNVIRAPGAGVVASRSTEVGGVVAPGQMVFAIESRVGGMILAAVPVKLAPSIKPGMPALYSADNVQGTARVVGASPRIEGGGVAQVRLKIETGKPAPGSIVHVKLTASDADARVVRVPITAIQTDPSGQRIVYRISHNHVVPVPVTLLDLNGADARVTAPLTPGTPIVAAGGAYLRAGQPVLIAKPGA